MESYLIHSSADMLWHFGIHDLYWQAIKVQLCLSCLSANTHTVFLYSIHNAYMHVCVEKGEIFHEYI